MHRNQPSREQTTSKARSLNRRRSALWAWGPVLLWLAGIFYFSARPDPLGFLFNAIPGAAARPLPPPNGELADRPLPLPQARLNLDIGGLAHFAEYAGLMAWLLRALRLENPHRTAPAAVLTALALALPLAVLDESYQELIPGRGFETGDVLLDLAGMLLIGAVFWTFNLKERNH